MTGRLAPFARAEDSAIQELLKGFVLVHPLEYIAEQTGMSARTCRTILLSLRPRLLRPRYYPWTRPDGTLALWDDRAIEAGLRGFVSTLANCYYDRACQSNYAQGLREERGCRSCPLDALDSEGDFGAEYLDAMRHHIDLIRFVYDRIGVKGERRMHPRTLFQLRYLHTMAVLRGREESRKRADGDVDFRDRSPLSSRSLYETLLADLRGEPLEKQEVYREEGEDRYDADERVRVTRKE
ncbi:hypothetical protein [Oceanibaculum pacificum]|uniref:Uncharacterized protein n=1 Tax=Oceanibaculum pacificum TaxID=580166 RepID=A0A154WFV1_9PROT|nr:hypothetical protein [Oceanibaculum pacificum]KZD12403.1 hypothetical protein AUP43_16430 [Oceanibaculum pacificum]